jgi:WD40 repeat protein
MFRHTLLLIVMAVFNLRAEPPAKLEGHTREIYALAFSAKGDKLVSTSSDGSIRVWNLADGTATVIKTGTGSRTVAISPDGTLIAGRFENKAMLWNAANGEQVAALVGTDPSNDGTVMRVAFSPDGKTLAVGHQMGLVRLWDVATKKPVAELTSPGNKGGLEFTITSLGYAPDGKLLAVGSQKSLTLWNAATFQVHKELTTLSTFSAEFTPDGKRLVVNDEDRVPFLKIRDVASAANLHTSDAKETADRHLKQVRVIDDSLALGVNQQDEFELFDLEKYTRTKVTLATPYKRGPGGFAISPDHKTVAHYFGGNLYAIYLQTLPKAK